VRIYTVTCNGKPAAVVRAENPSDAVDTAGELGIAEGVRRYLAAREPNDAEMVSWLEHREDHLLPAAENLAVAS
jgi:hypothetical protein